MVTGTKKNPTRAPGIPALARLLLASLVVALLTVAGPTAAQTPPPEAILDLQELIRLLEVAKESGFTEEQLKEITVEDEGRLINAWAYVQAWRSRKEAEARKREEREKRVYLTVRDVVTELLQMEPADLRRLRNELALSE